MNKKVFFSLSWCGGLMTSHKRKAPERYYFEKVRVESLERFFSLRFLKDLQSPPWMDSCSSPHDGPGGEGE
jgi:hypothetical protein